MRALLYAAPRDAPRSAARDYAALLLRRRPGLADPARFPLLERALPEARLDPLWLAAYRAITGLGGAATAALPPLALQLAAAPLHLSLLADPAFPFRALGIVHVGQSVRQTGPLPADSHYSLRAFTSEAKEAKRGMTFGLVTEASLAGKVVWRAETTALAPSREKKPDGPRPAPSADPGPAWTERGMLDAPEPLGRRYAAVAQDLNPIHQHALLARPFGFKRAIVHGTWTLAAALGKAGLPFGDDYTLQVRFLKPVFLPSRIAVGTRAEASGQAVRVTSLDGAVVHLSAVLTPGSVPA